MRHEDNQLKNDRITDTTLRLLAYCRANRWAGYDPYDALNSRVLQALPFLNFKMARLILTQTVKRCPVNFRPLLLVPESPNPKGTALFLSSLVKLSRVGATKNRQEIRALADSLLALKSPGERYSCWGYNFDWQTRTELVPSRSPNIICSTFAANALIDAYDQMHDASWLEAAVSAAEYILRILYRRLGSSVACFSYTQLESSKIHNANLLGAAFLCRVGQISGRSNLLQPALDAARYSVSKQHTDGSWPYGEGSHQTWIDNFHTGFNLVALKRIRKYGRTLEFDAALRSGFDFYRGHFFRDDGAPRYYQNASYPLDIHSAAQSIITLVEFKDISKENCDLARRVLGWAMANMWDPRGFFYFQKRRCYTVRIPFMRWSQAWMLLALSTLLESSPDEVGST